jgi:hypothetical protein
MAALDHGTSQKGRYLTTPHLDNTHSTLPGLWPLFGSKDKVTPPNPAQLRFFLVADFYAQRRREK